MKNFVRTLVPLAGVAIALAGCVAYPAGYGYGPSYGGGYGYSPSVAVAVPCCAYGGDNGYRGYGGEGYRRW